MEGAKRELENVQDKAFKKERSVDELERRRKSLEAENLQLQQRATDAERSGRMHEYASLLMQAFLAAEDHPDSALDMLENCTVAHRKWEWSYLKSCCRRVTKSTQGGSSPITDLQISPDGTFAAVVHEDGILEVWSFVTAERLATEAVHAGAIRSVAFSADGTRIATCGSDRAIGIWDARSGKQMGRLEVSRDIGAIALSPDGQFVATGTFQDNPFVGKDTAIRIRETDGGNVAHVLTGHSEPARHLRFSKDGTMLVSASNDKSIRVWDVARGKSKQVIGAKLDFLPDLELSPDSRLVATVEPEARAIRLWDTNTGRHVRRLPCSQGKILDISFARDGRTVAAVTTTRWVIVWDVSSGDPVRAVPVDFTTASEKTVQAARVQSVGRRLCVGWALGADFRMERTPSGLSPTCLHKQDSAISDLCFDDPGQNLLVAWKDGTVGTWSTKTWNRSKGGSLELQQADKVALDPSHLHVVLARASDVQVVDPATSARILQLSGHTTNVAALACSPDGSRIVTTVEDGTTRIWNGEDGQQLREFAGTAGCSSIAFSRDATQFAVGAQNGDVVIMSALQDRAAEPIVLKGHGGPIWDLVFSPTGKWLASASQDRTVRVWDIDNASEPQVLKGHFGPVKTVSFSPDGQRLVSSGDDRTLRIWAWDAGLELLRLRAGTAPISAVGWHPEGDTIVAGASDGAIYSWSSPTQIKSADDPERANQASEAE